VLADSRVQPHLEVNEDALRKELSEIRASGYSTDLEGGESGICCVGAPVMDSSGRVVAAISVSTPSDRFDRSNVAALGELVRSTADQISEAAGYLTPNKMASLRQFVLDSARRPDTAQD
jgi:DNA-binding IclR family transcriptional regulator